MQQVALADPGAKNDFLSERIDAVFAATGSQLFESEGGMAAAYWSNPPQGVSPFDADIYFHYKLDKPHHLMLRVVRKLLLWPLLKRQVAFNHAVRTTLLRLWFERNELRGELQDTKNRLADLEKKVALLAAKQSAS